MGKIGVEHLCKGCMSFLQYTDRPCPKCGFDEKWFYSGKEYLKVASILNDRYLVGKILEQNDYELIYIGWDLEANTKVTIRECYVKDIARRDSTVSNNIYLNDQSKIGFFDGFKKNYLEESTRLIELGNLFGIIWTYDAICCNNTAYIITEYMEYVTLDEFIEQRGGRISIYEVLSFLQPVVYSLRTIHEKGIYHGNINLKSIVINSNNDVVLMGFGINTNLSVKRTYKDDIQGLCKIIYKIVCGPRFLNNMTCYKETGKLMMPNSVKDYIINALTKGLAPGQNTLYDDITDFYSDIFDNQEYLVDSQAVGFMNNMNNYNAQQAGATGYVNQPGMQNGNMQYMQYNNMQYGQNTSYPGQYNGQYEGMKSGSETRNQYIAVNSDLKTVKKKNKVLLSIAAVATIMIFVMCKFIIFDNMDNNKMDNTGKSQAGSESSDIAGAITWTEPDIEAIVRKELGKNDDEEITEEEVKGIKTLTIRKKDITNVNDLKYFTGLDTLILNNNSKLEDITGLESLSNLTELNLSCCNITDISHLRLLKKLKILDLSKNKSLSDISILNRLTELSTLNLNECNVTDVKILRNITSLRYLSLASNHIQDITPLGEMTTLTRLDLAGNGITDWSGVEAISRVNGRSYTLNVEFCYQRAATDYNGWLLHTWRRDPSVAEYDKDLPMNFLFEESSTASTINFEFDMVEDYFSFALYKQDDPKIKDIETNRNIEIGLTKGTVSVKVCVYEGNENPVVIIK